MSDYKYELKRLNRIAARHSSRNPIEQPTREFDGGLDWKEQSGRQGTVRTFSGGRVVLADGVSLVREVIDGKSGHVGRAVSHSLACCT